MSKKPSPQRNDNESKELEPARHMRSHPNTESAKPDRRSDRLKKNTQIPSRSKDDQGDPHKVDAPMEQQSCVPLNTMANTGPNN